MYNLKPDRRFSSVVQTTKDSRKKKERAEFEKKLAELSKGYKSDKVSNFLLSSCGNLNLFSDTE